MGFIWKKVKWKALGSDFSSMFFWNCWMCHPKAHLWQSTCLRSKQRAARQTQGVPDRSQVCDKVDIYFVGHDGCFCWCSLYTWKHWFRDIFWPTLANIWCIMALKMRTVAVYRPVLVIGFEVDIQCFWPRWSKDIPVDVAWFPLGVLDFFHSGWMKHPWCTLKLGFNFWQAKQHRESWKTVSVFYLPLLFFIESSSQKYVY